MRDFEFSGLLAGAKAREAIGTLLEIVALRERLSSGAPIKPAVLDALFESARAQSTEASNRIEGIRTSEARLKKIVASKAEPRTRDEQEIAGYRDVLKTVHESWEYIDVTPNVILQLHQNLYRHTQSSVGGHFKVGDNEIRGFNSVGEECVRFEPVSAVATPDAMERLCAALRDALNGEPSNDLSLLFALEFVFDFTCIHPFNDGNGRMSRLLTLLLMYKLGFGVGRYVSVERKIENSKGAYYDALEASSIGWSEGENDASHFVCYMLQVILEAYRELAQRAEEAAGEKGGKAERIELYLNDSVGKVTKSDLREACPGVSETTVERTLHDLLEQGKVKKVGGGRGTGYVWLRDF